MSQRAPDIAVEIASIERKADQACSIHALLRDRFQRRADLLDYGLMAAATYLVGLSLVEPALGISLSLGLDRTKLTTVLTLITFFLSAVQFKNDWKAKAQAHQRSFDGYAEVKAACRTLTSGVRAVTAPEHQRIRDEYDVVTKIGTHIPDDRFLTGKAHHQRKVFVSRYLDAHPGARPVVVKLKLFLRDNLNLDLLGPDGKHSSNAG